MRLPAVHEARGVDVDLGFMQGGNGFQIEQG
jgi:hypothetical protein